MTMTFPVKRTKDLEIYYNTHGEFVLAKLGSRIGIELSQFSDIIDAFAKESNNPFDPFYKSTFGPKGMMLTKKYIFAYRNGNGILLESRGTTFDGMPNGNVDQINLTLEELKEAYNCCKNYRGFLQPDMIELKLDPVNFGELRLT